MTITDGKACEKHNGELSDEKVDFNGLLAKVKSVVCMQSEVRFFRGVKFV